MGAKESGRMFCPNCGNEYESGKFCTRCGQRLDADGAQETTEAETFEQQKARLMKNRIPHCPKCLSTHITALPVGEGSLLYHTRFVCFWCGHEWVPYKEDYPNAVKRHFLNI